MSISGYLWYFFYVLFIILIFFYILLLIMRVFIYLFFYYPLTFIIHNLCKQSKCVCSLNVSCARIQEFRHSFLFMCVYLQHTPIYILGTHTVINNIIPILYIYIHGSARQIPAASLLTKFRKHKFLINSPIVRASM